MDNVMSDMAIGKAQRFEHDVFGSLTVLLRNKKPWFIAKELSDRLGYSDSHAMTRKLQPKYKETVRASTLEPWLEKLEEARKPWTDAATGTSEASNSRKNPALETALISESGFYMAVMRSDKKEAMAFQEWVIEEVLPSIREHGMYATDKTLDAMLSDPDAMIQAWTQIKEERQARRIAEAIAREKEQEALEANARTKEVLLIAHETQSKLRGKEIKIKADAPKVEMYDRIVNSEDTYCTSSIAIALGTTVQSLNKYLGASGVQYYKGGRWFLFKEHLDRGLTKETTSNFNGNFRSYMRWTATGREEVIKLWDLGHPRNRY